MGKWTIQELMTENPVTLRLTDDLAEAADLMKRKKIRHLPILNHQGKLAGLITHRDILRYSVSEWDISDDDKDILRASIQVGEVMVPVPVTLSPGDSLKEAADLILEKKIGCVVIVEQDKLVGILTEGDFVRFLRDQSE